MRIAETDPSTRSRIREAALRLMAERGLAGTSIRDVAREAGVSPGLVQHHFHTKERLKQEVDAWVVEQLRGEFESVTVSGSMAQVSDQFCRAVVRFGTSCPELPAFIARTLLEGGAMAEGMFDGLVGLTRASLELVAAEGGLWPGTDMVWASIQLTMMWLGPLLVQPLIERHLDQPLISDAGIERWRLANAALVRRGLLSPERDAVEPG
ncbi:MAG TPA: TetR/AcrR family transcriptional regulator [Candidatus Dormibacteraeota bacterium]|jgi:AcrR family transcriptional regulator|nr:TetR/AcrR family transcriptional regulator [Candidatus Dormibacteraeota bacterium]